MLRKRLKSGFIPRLQDMLWMGFASILPHLPLPPSVAPWCLRRALPYLSFWAQTWEFWERYSVVFGMLPGVGPPRRVIPTGQSFLFLNSKTRVVWLSQHGLNFQFSFQILLAVFQFSSGQLCLTSCDPMDCSTPGFPVPITNSQSLLKLMSIALVMPSNHLIFCHLLLPLQSSPALGSFPMSQLFTSGGQKY